MVGPLRPFLLYIYLIGCRSVFLLIIWCSNSSDLSQLDWKRWKPHSISWFTFRVLLTGHYKVASDLVGFGALYQSHDIRVTTKLQSNSFVEWQYKNNMPINIGSPLLNNNSNCCSSTWTWSLLINNEDCIEFCCDLGYGLNRSLISKTNMFTLWLFYFCVPKQIICIIWLAYGI